MISLANSATKLPDDVRGSVVVCGSHGGLYPAYLVARAAVTGAIFNDAGNGKDNAGIASLAYLEKLGIPAATVSNMSCRIGDVSDMMQRGRISHANAIALELGVVPDESCATAAQKMTAATTAAATPAPISESRRLGDASGTRAIVLIDSASLVRPEDKGQIVVTGSHGGLVGGNPALTLQVDAFAAVFHDAGIGADEAGITRLPALDRRGIAAVTVAAGSARIGDAGSIYEDGIISFANELARRNGAEPGAPLRELLQKWARS
ncbi:hypothetical protein ACUSIJ_16865 [Pseudochelatococcus sp. B33]